MVKPHEPLSDEMISAYLDDEVSPAERALIERTLQQDARLRQLYEELCAVRDALQTLPPQRLDAGFSAKLAQRIRQLRSSDVEEGATVSVAPARPDRLSAPRGFRRGLVWAALAVTAAVLLMVFQPPEQAGNRQVVRVTPTDASAQQPAPTPTSPQFTSPPPAVAVEAGRASGSADEAFHLSESPERAAIRQAPAGPPFQAILRADVTADQLPEILAGLRQNPLSIIEEDAPEVQDLALRAIDRSESVAERSKRGPSRPAVRAVVVRGGVTDIQAVLRRLRVVARPASPAELEEMRTEGGATETDSSLAGDAATFARERGVPESAAESNADPAAGTGSVLVLLNVLPSSQPAPAAATPDEQD